MDDFGHCEIVVFVQTAAMIGLAPLVVPGLSMTPEFYVRGQLGAERLFLLHDLQGDQGRGHWKLLKKIGDANGIDPAYQPGTALRADGGRIDLPSPQALPGMNNILNANYNAAFTLWQTLYGDIFAYDDPPLDGLSPPVTYYAHPTRRSLRHV
jgi:hypothetical protein